MLPSNALQLCNQINYINQHIVNSANFDTAETIAQVTKHLTEFK